MRVSGAREAKNRQKSVFPPQKPKKIVEIKHFSIDFDHPEAALLPSAGFFVAA
jgi:hypothetical protein